MAQGFNSDPQGWELTDKFGDRSLRIWLEILAILDREKNSWKLVNGWDSVISRKVRQSPATVRRVVGWMLANGWLEVGQLSASGQPEVVRARNYPKYHKTRSEVRPPPNLTYPNLTEPTPPKSPKGGQRVSDLAFENFWREYPRKVGKGAALRTWKKDAGISVDTQSAIMAALPKHKEHWNRQQTENRYIPHPATWLNQRRWEDEFVSGQDPFDETMEEADARLKRIEEGAYRARHR